MYKNIVANFFGRSISIILIVCLTPLYIDILGFEAYGIIGFFATVQSLFALLELGFPLALNRAIARFTGGESNANEMSSLLRGFESIFFIIAAILFLLSLPLAIFFASSWFEFEKLSYDTVVSSLTAIFVLGAIRFPIGLYLAVLAGLQKQVLMNFWLVFFVVLRLGAATLFIAIIEPDIVAFFMIQIAVAVLEVFVVRFSAWRSDVEFDRYSKIEWPIVLNQLKFAASVGLISIFGVLITQVDKLMVSGSLSLEMFGHYSLISLFGLGLATLGYPISNAIFPQLSKLHALGKVDEMIELFWKNLRLVTVLIMPIGLSVVFFSDDAISYYLGQALQREIGLAFSVFLVASVFGALRPVPYSMLVAAGDTNLILKFYGFSILIYPLVLYILLVNMGIVGASIGFFFMQLISLMTFLICSLYQLRIQSIFKLIFVKFITPFFLCLLISFLSSFLIRKIGADSHLIINLAVVYFLTASILFNYMYSKDERASFAILVIKQSKKLFGSLA